MEILFSKLPNKILMDAFGGKSYKKFEKTIFFHINNLRDQTRKIFQKSEQFKVEICRKLFSFSGKRCKSMIHDDGQILN
jgi:hypothetical protein